MRSVLVFLLLLVVTNTVSAQGIPADTLELDGANFIHTSVFSSYWLDELGKDLPEIISTLNMGKFKNWQEETTLNIGLNPNPLWIYLNVKNVAPEQARYWWSLYSHADTVIFYRNFPKGWIAIDTARFLEHYNDRDVSVRFLSTEINLMPGESAQLLMRVRNLRKAQHAAMDITTPDHNLQWEKKFFWIIGLVSGGLVLTAIFNMVLGVVTRQRTFFILFAYALLVNLVILQEELLIVLYPSYDTLSFFMRLPTMGLVIIGCGLHYLVLGYLIETNSTLVKWLSHLNNFGLIYGLVVCLIYFVFFDYLHSGQYLFRFLWHFSSGLIFLMLGLQVILVFTLVRTIGHVVLAFFFNLAILYFSPAGYFLNYEGILSYYSISYPNYFFWGLCAEFLVFGIVVAWHYRRIMNNHAKLLKERSRHKNELYQMEIQTQERERMQIARNLHDDLGATISAINLIVTNSYSHDSQLTKTVNKANADLRFFLSNFSGANIKGDSLFEVIGERVLEINGMSETRFSFSHEGSPDKLPDDLSMVIFRIVCELMANVMKHAHASQSQVQVVIDQDQLLIMAEDNGHGFDVSKKYSGMGLSNIHDRVYAFNGKVHITSNTHSGTTTIINLPFPS